MSEGFGDGGGRDDRGGGSEPIAVDGPPFGSHEALGWGERRAAAATLPPAALEALGRVHGPRQGVEGPGSALSARTIAQALSQMPGQIAMVADEGCTGASLHPIGDNVRIRCAPKPGPPRVERCIEGWWSPLPQVAIEGSPATGFTLDRGALERAVGPLACDLDAALAGAGEPMPSGERAAPGHAPQAG